METDTETISSVSNLPIRDRWLKAAIKHASDACDEMHHAFYELKDEESPSTNRALLKTSTRLVNELYDFIEALKRADRSRTRIPKTKRKRPYADFLREFDKYMETFRRQF
jgi:hypothetical protein